jgi:superfamily I DNA/RNA helicase
MQNEIIRIFDPSSVMPEEQIVGSDGEIFYWSFDNSQIESTFLATQIEKWIKIDGLLHSEIAILVSKQSDLYADLLMNELEKKRIIYRNEQQLQDISVEPAAILIVDYLRVLYGTREPKSWIRLMDKLIPFTDEDEQENLRQKWQSFIISEKKEAKRLDLMGERWPTAWSFVINFLNKIGRNNLTALSQEYESFNRLKQVVQETKTRIHELTIIEPDLLKALNRFADDQAIRILTIHKSKGLEFNTVIILGVEKETFWGKPHEERCAFFVGMSRAKQRLILTTCQTRRKPKSNPYRWDEKRTPHVEFIGYAEPFLTI